MKLSYRIGKSYRGLFDGSLTDQFILCEGRRGTAKTASILKCLTMRAFKWPGTRYLIARSTRARLSESVITTFDNHVLPSFGLKAPVASASHRTGYDFPTIQGKRSRFIFMALDDPGRSQSVEADGAYISEAVELDSQDQAATLTAAIRPRVEAAKVGKDLPSDPFPGLVRQVILDCNPGAPGHWLNKVAEPADDDLRCINTAEDYARVVAFNQQPSVGGWKRIITSLPDNPGYWDKAAWAPTAACDRYLNGLSSMSPFMRARWLQGLWAAAEGVVFPEFSEVIHVVDDFTPPSDWPFVVGYDPGYDHPTGCPWICFAPNGDIFITDEIYEGGQSVHHHCETISRKNAGRTVRRYYGDPHEMFSTRAQNTKSCAAQALERGLRFIPWANQGKTAMVNAFRQLLINTVRGEGRKVYIMRRCVNTIMELQSWAFKRNSDGTRRDGDDAYEDKNNHLIDGIVGILALGLQYEGGGIEIL